jgi:hypothetical protein
MRCQRLGWSVPEIDPEDVGTVPIPRIEESRENEIADLIEAAAKARDTADEIEQALTISAEGLVDEFLAGSRKHFVVTGMS